MLPRIFVCWLAVLLVATSAQAQEAGLRLDAFDDPLPAGAQARLGTLRFKHQSPRTLPPQFRDRFGSNSVIRSAVFSPDGSRVATIAQPSNNLRLWDVATGRELNGPWNLADEYLLTYGIAFSPDGSILASACLRFDFMLQRSLTVFVWNIDEAKTVTTIPLGQTNAPSALAFRDGGKSLVVVEGIRRRGEPGVTVGWWDVATGNSLHTWSSSPKEPAQEMNQEQAFFQYSAAFGPATLGVRTIKYEMSAVQQGYRQTQTETAFYAFEGIKNPGRILHKTTAKDAANSAENGIAFSADGKTMAFLAAQGVVELRSTSSGKLLNLLDLQAFAGRSSIQDLAIAPDGRSVAVSSGSSMLNLWNQREPEAFREFDFHSNFAPKGLAFSPDGKTLVAGLGPDIRLLDLASLKETRSWSGHREPVQTVVFSEDGRTLRTGTATRGIATAAELITWDTATWKQVQAGSLLEREKRDVGVMSPDGKVYLGKAAKDRLNVYEAKTGKLLGRLSIPAGPNPNQIGFFSPDSKFYVLPAVSAGSKSTQLLYSVPSCKLLCQLPAMGTGSDPRFFRGVVSDAGPQIVFSANGRVAALHVQDGRIAVVETATGAVKYRLGEIPPREILEEFDVVAGGQLELSPDGKYLASWTLLDNRTRIWDLTTGKERRSLPRDDSSPDQVRFAWSPDGRTLATARSRTVRLWETGSLRLRKEFRGHLSEVLALTFSPDGRQLATASADTTVLVWEVRAR